MAHNEAFLPTGSKRLTQGGAGNAAPRGRLPSQGRGTDASDTGFAPPGATSPGQTPPKSLTTILSDVFNALGLPDISIPVVEMAGAPQTPSPPDGSGQVPEGEFDFTLEDLLAAATDEEEFVNGAREFFRVKRSSL